MQRAQRGQASRTATNNDGVPSFLGGHRI
jgi:hypothetical protein